MCLLSACVFVCRWVPGVFICVCCVSGVFICVSVECLVFLFVCLLSACVFVCLLGAWCFYLCVCWVPGVFICVSVGCLVFLFVCLLGAWCFYLCVCWVPGVFICVSVGCLVFLFVCLLGAWCLCVFDECLSAPFLPSTCPSSARPSGSSGTTWTTCSATCATPTPGSGKRSSELTANVSWRRRRR